ARPRALPRSGVAGAGDAAADARAQGLHAEPVAVPRRPAAARSLSARTAPVGAALTIGEVNALLPRLRRGTVVAVLALVIAGGSLAGCGGGGNTSCGTDGCTVTFARSGSSEVSVLGVSARL